MGGQILTQITKEDRSSVNGRNCSEPQHSISTNIMCVCGMSEVSCTDQSNMYRYVQELFCQQFIKQQRWHVALWCHQGRDDWLAYVRGNIFQLIHVEGGGLVRWKLPSWWTKLWEWSCNGMRKRCRWSRLTSRVFSFSGTQKWFKACTQTVWKLIKLSIMIKAGKLTRMLCSLPGHPFYLYCSSTFRSNIWKINVYYESCCA